MAKRLSQKRPLEDKFDSSENFLDEADSDSDVDKSFGKQKKKSKQKSVAKGKENKKAHLSIPEDDISVDDEEALDSGTEESLTKHEAGQIKKIYVENFMCHRKLTVPFGYHVNFVTGENGSGM